MGSVGKTSVISEQQCLLGTRERTGQVAMWLPTLPPGLRICHVHSARVGKEGMLTTTALFTKPSPRMGVSDCLAAGVLGEGGLVEWTQRGGGAQVLG